MFEASPLAGVRATLVAAVIVLAAGWAPPALYLAGLTPAWTALALHAALAAALGFWSWQTARATGDVRLPMLLAVTAAALGPAGAAGTLVTIGLTRWYSRKAITFAEWYESLFPEPESQPVVEMLERIAASGLEAFEGDLAAFADVLAFGSLEQKQELIALVSRRYRPVFAPILKKALNDANNAVRVQAATAISKLEHAFFARTVELERAAGRGGKRRAALLELARHYDDYSYAGILDASRADENRALALAAYRRYLEAWPDDAAARLAVGRLLLRSRRCEEAAAWLEESFRSGLEGAQAHLYYMECLYETRRYAELREFSRPRRAGFESLSDFPAAAVEAVALWAGEGVPAEVTP